MGACFNMFSCRADSDTDAINKCHDYISDCKYESGHGGYTGTFAEAHGVELTNKCFDSRDDAYWWLEDHAQKWGPALGVKVNTKDGAVYLFGALCSE